jgi:hypothetical protein
MYISLFLLRRRFAIEPDLEIGYRFRSHLGSTGSFKSSLSQYPGQVRSVLLQECGGLLVSCAVLVLSVLLVPFCQAPVVYKSARPSCSAKILFLLRRWVQTDLVGFDPGRCHRPTPPNSSGCHQGGRRLFEAVRALPGLSSSRDISIQYRLQDSAGSRDTLDHQFFLSVTYIYALRGTLCEKWQSALAWRWRDGLCISATPAQFRYESYLETH